MKTLILSVFLTSIFLIFTACAEGDFDDELDSSIDDDAECINGDLKCSPSHKMILMCQVGEWEPVFNCFNYGDAYKCTSYVEGKFICED